MSDIERNVESAERIVNQSDEADFEGHRLEADAPEKRMRRELSTDPVEGAGRKATPDRPAV